MMSVKSKLLLLIIFFLVQLAVPIHMIYQKQNVLVKGKEFLIKCQPYDPVHPTMGRYIQLNFIDNNGIPVKGNEDFSNGDRVYVGIKKNSSRFSEFISVSKTPPQGDYFKANFWYYTYPEMHIEEKTYRYVPMSPKGAIVEVPFDRYYMEENKAPKADEIISKIGREIKEDVYAKVRILDGEASLESVYVGNQGIEDYVNK